MRPEEVCVCSRNPASDKSAITLRIDAGLRPSRFERESVRDPTGSPVEMKVSTIAVRISRSRFPILGSTGMVKVVSVVSIRSAAAGGETAQLPFYLSILDAEA